MWPHAIATLRASARLPATWLIPGIGVLVGWFGMSLGILALGDLELENREMALATTEGTGVLLVLWLLARHLDEDARSGFAVAAEQTAPGSSGRLVGRWAGSVVAAVAPTLLVGTALGLMAGLEARWVLWLVTTSTCSLAIAGAWGLLLGALGSGTVVVLGGMTLWLAGHLPWGTDPLLPGPIGALLRAWLPGARLAEGGIRLAGYTSAAILGTLLLTLALTRRTVPRG